MTTKETYTLQGNDADGWVEIGMQTFKGMLDAGYCAEWFGSFTRSWCAGSRNMMYSSGPFRTRHSEYMRYINRTYPLWIGYDMGFDERTLFRCTAQEGERTAPPVRKSRPDLLPSEAVLAAGRVLAFGLEKHPDELWKTLSVAEHCAAALRHIYEHQNGPDPETSESHLAHALCRIAFAIARDNG